MRGAKAVSSKSGKCMTFLPGELDVPVSQDCESILDLALKAGLDMDHTCGGNGTCGTCMIEVCEGLEKFKPRNEIEQEFADERGLKDFERLSCQNRPQEGLIVKVPHKTDLYKSK